MSSLEVNFTPADFALLKQRDLSRAVCVVFDVLRATSSMITALANGAEAILPVEEIPEALAERERDPRVLLAGERDGLRITSELTGSIGFDLGNSPREFTPEKVRGQTIVISTTNGTRALRACGHARQVLASSFLNLERTAQEILSHKPEHLVLICSGTFEEAALEDVLGAGALCDLLWPVFGGGKCSDAALIALQMYRANQHDLAGALAMARNGRRLLSRPELREDVAFCLQRNRYPLVAVQQVDGRIRKQI
jgi:2-phosphosulfolactate phosphatase